MKIVISLCVLQSLLLTILVLQSLFPSKEAISPSSTTAPEHPAVMDSKVLSSNASSSLDETRLRQIIREEFYAFLELPVSEPNESMASSDMTASRMPGQDTPHYSEVKEKIAVYKAVGKISSDQMQELQASIMKLDQPRRREVLSELMRAMNSGEIKGLL